MAKLTDFGLSVIMANAANSISAAEAGSHPHTERWAAPEVLDGADVDEKADVYSFAMLLFEIFSRAVRSRRLQSPLPPAVKCSLLT